MISYTTNASTRRDFNLNLDEIRNIGTDVIRYFFLCRSRKTLFIQLSTPVTWLHTFAFCVKDAIRVFSRFSRFMLILRFTPSISRWTFDTSSFHISFYVIVHR